MVTHKQYLVDLVHARAAGDGTRIAVEQGARSVTYGELSRLVGTRESELRAHGADNAVVAIERVKSIEFIVDYLAVLAVGGVVVPLDPDLPPARRCTFLDLARPQFLLGDGTLIVLDGPSHPDLPNDGAFVYFTSGSTGIPKPVLGSARGVRTFVDWFGPRFGFGPDDRFAFLAGVSFEAGLRDIFPPLSVGAAIVIPSLGDTGSPEATVEWLAGARISAVTAVPSVARGWLRHGRGKCPSMRAVFFVGEPLAPDVQAGWHAMFPATTVQVNSYGSTESGQGTVYRQIAAGEEFADRVPAGRPVPGTRFCLIPPEAPLDASVLAETLTAGEIVLVSRSCSHGYLGMPAENAARFADLGDGETAYRTGDLGRVDEHGELVVVGRADDEVKINGVRVHPVEVTRALRSMPGVADAFVVAVRLAEPRLTAYVVPSAGTPLSIADLRLELLDVLPLAMIPSRFVEMAQLPVARTGKVDRARLTALAEQDAAAAVFVAPDGEVECWLADRFAELLDLPRVSATDDLFALGGDSITATRLASRIADDLGVELSQRAIFASATVAGIATAVLQEQLLDLDPDELTAMLDSLGSA